MEDLIMKNSDPELAVRVLIQSVGEDPDREGLLETPKRYVKFLDEFTTTERFNFTTFEDSQSDEMIIVKAIPFYSLCEHHMVPFFGTADIAYVPNGKIVGISKIPRCLDHYANRLQNQERITHQVADRLMEELKPKGVAVVLIARHLCMEMRGAEKPGAITMTSAMKGVFKDQINTRQEFLNLRK